jgi:hypothetical protein
MFLTVFFVLLALWLLGFFAFHIAGGLIQFLLVIAVISLVVHLFRGRRMALRSRDQRAAARQSSSQPAPARQSFVL